MFNTPKIMDHPHPFTSGVTDYMELNVIYRSCTRVHSVHAGSRPCDASKLQVVLVCLYSLLRSCPENAIVHVLDDHSLPDDVERIQQLLAEFGERHNFISIDDTGNGQSMEATYDYARHHQFELVYFCEDDYLHLEGAIPSMLGFYNNFDGDCIVFPTDYIDRYLNGALYQSYIHLGEDRHWRTIRHTTGTFMISGVHIKKYWKLLNKFAAFNKSSSGGENQTINKIYTKETCVSPIPSLAAHFSPEPAMSPFNDWEALFLSMKKKLGL
ncbi:MAG: glycosyltransferase involved in cell wall biosynthesis [Pirellulaceae bacterium]|jgi:glycosyltransferase involved in cell wall biosynthesis